MPGGRARRGPAHETGEQRSLWIGSVSTTAFGRRIRKLAWLMKVIAADPAGTVSGGGGKAGLAMPEGQIAGWLCIRQRSTVRRPREELGTPGLKNRWPSQWSEIG
ncbi:hypothetical protein GALL_529330 [mine drainage metagenome]|uniref:Uncharacterized protein n=1 Tax=mine drainage metagenome TaxID=410659 RepID=A0A1J5PJP7_9ZZZZ